MDSSVIRLILAIAALAIAAIVNYRAISMADLQPSAIRTAGVLFGLLGLLLVILIPFLPLLALASYFSEHSVGAEGMATLFPIAIIGAVICTLVSGALLLAKRIAGRKREA